MTTRTGRPELAVRIYGRGRVVDFQGDLWECLLQMANARELGFDSEFVPMDRMKGGR